MAAMTEGRAISDAAEGNQDDEDDEDGRLKQ
jgi:hypothetical protein